jgi:hypothetical protein
MGLLIFGAARLAMQRGEGPERDRQLALLGFVAAPLAIVSFQAFVSRAHANWAGAAYPAAVIFVTLSALRAGRPLLLKASLALHAVVAAVFVGVFGSFAFADLIGASNGVKRLRQWETTGAEVNSAAEGFDAIVVDDRELMASLLYYARGGPPIYSLNSNRRIDHHFEAFMDYRPERGDRVLFVYEAPEPLGLNGAYDKVEFVGESVVDLKKGRARRLYFFAVEGLKP